MHTDYMWSRTAARTLTNARKKFSSRRQRICMPGYSVLLATVHALHIVWLQILCDLTMDQGQSFHLGVSPHALPSGGVPAKSGAQPTVIGGIAEKESQSALSKKNLGWKYVSQRTYLLFIPKWQGGTHWTIRNWRIQVNCVVIKWLLCTSVTENMVQWHSYWTCTLTQQSQRSLVKNVD